MLGANIPNFKQIIAKKLKAMLDQDYYEQIGLFFNKIYSGIGSAGAIPDRTGDRT